MIWRLKNVYVFSESAGNYTGTEKGSWSEVFEITAYIQPIVVRISSQVYLLFLHPFDSFCSFALHNTQLKQLNYLLHIIVLLICQWLSFVSVLAFLTLQGWRVP